LAVPHANAKLKLLSCYLTPFPSCSDDRFTHLLVAQPALANKVHDLTMSGYGR